MARMIKRWAAIAITSLSLIAGCSTAAQGHAHFSGTPSATYGPSVPSGSVRVFDSRKMAEAIELSAQGRQLGLQNVTCPSSEKVQAGITFECRTDSGTIHVVVKDDSGAFTWTPPG